MAEVPQNPQIPDGILKMMIDKAIQTPALASLGIKPTRETTSNGDYIKMELTEAQVKDILVKEKPELAKMGMVLSLADGKATVKFKI